MCYYDTPKVTLFKKLDWLRNDIRTNYFEGIPGTSKIQFYLLIMESTPIEMLITLYYKYVIYQMTIIVMTYKLTNMYLYNVYILFHLHAKFVYLKALWVMVA